MAFCRPCNLLDKDEECNSCPLSRYFIVDDDMVNLLVLSETYKLGILREKVLDLETMNCSVTLWIKMEVGLSAVNEVLEQRISALESNLEMLMKAKEKLAEDPVQSESKQLKISDDAGRRETLAFSMDEFQTLLAALEAEVEKGLDINLLLWSKIRHDRFHGTVRTSVDLKDIFRRCAKAAMSGKITSTMKFEDIGRVVAVANALEVWRMENEKAARLAKGSKKAAKLKAKK